MYLRTPKRYTTKGRPRLINLRWAWLYLLTPVVLVCGALIWNYRDQISPQVQEFLKRNVKVPSINFNPPTITPTAPPDELQRQLTQSLSAGNMQKVVDILDQLTTIQPNNEELYSWRTRLILLRTDVTDLDSKVTQDNLKRALDAGQSAINASPEQPDGWVATAMVLDWSGKPQQALQYALRARDLSEKDPLVLASLAEIYFDLQKYDLAGKTVDEALAAGNAQQSPSKMAMTHAYFIKFRVLEQKTPGSDEGKTVLEKAWNYAISDPTIPAGYIATWLGILYQNDAPDKAIALYQKALDRDKDDPLMPYLLGLVYYKQGKTTEARQQFDKCLDLQPDQPKCLLNLGKLLYFSDQNYIKAIEVMEKLISEGTKETVPYYVAGQSYYSQNQCTKAIPLWQEGIKLVPNDKPQARQDFEDALRQCGITIEGAVSPTVQATVAPPTPTPKK